MSIWTHVNCSIRIDTIRIINELNFDSIINDFPEGSEGELSHHVWINPSESSLAAYTLNIFGDLRDFDDEAVVRGWFKALCKRILAYPAGIRSATLEISVENKDHASIVVFDGYGGKTRFHEFAYEKVQ